MSGSRACSWSLSVALLALCAGRAFAQDTQTAPDPHVAAARVDSSTVLDAYLKALEQKRLAPKPADDIEELKPVLEEAQRAVLDGKKDEATALLIEIVEGPRFRDFDGLAPFHTAELMLASALTERYALKSAQRVIDRVLARGPGMAAFEPAYRRAVDIAIARGDFAASATHLATFHRDKLPEDSVNELVYLEGRAAYERGALSEATQKLGKISKKSRFYVNAQYLLGAIAAKSRQYKEAEARFCAIAGAGKDNSYSFFIDGRFFPVRDLAHLGLGRVAHETGRASDAFYYYFQVPSDSDRLAEAMFEAAWASYEGGDHEAAIDSLDQLEARFPRSPHAAEASVLRGYVHLSRCEFAEAERRLAKFERDFTPVLREIDAALASPARKSGLYADLVMRQESVARLRANDQSGEPTPDSLLLSLVMADPDFYRLNSELRALDAELGRSGNVPSELFALSTRLTQDKAPAPRKDDSGMADGISGAEAELTRTKAAIDALGREITTLSRGGADKAALAPLRTTQRELDQRVAHIERNLRDAVRAAELEASRPTDSDLQTLLRKDQAYVAALRSQAHRVRVDLSDAADRAGERALTDLRERLAAELRRARIGRIDAVMGSKRQVEIQIESLSVGRFPPELADALRMQTLLRDDEEYWPFEGEDWPDEFLERYPDKDDGEDEP